MLAEEDELVHHLAGSFFPTHVEMIFFHDAFVLLQQPHLLIGETFYTLQTQIPENQNIAKKKTQKPVKSNGVQHNASRRREAEKKLILMNQSKAWMT